MIAWKTWLALTLLPLTPTAVVVSLAQGAQPVTPLAFVKPELDCGQPPTFSIGYKREENGLTAQGAGFDFQGLSWLQADFCSTGTLLVAAEGQSAAGEAPELTFMLNSKPLATKTFNGRKTYLLRIPEPGRLTISYLNDYYFMDARVAYLDNFALTRSTCNQLKIEVPTGAGGWYPETNTAVLVAKIPATLVPCGPGHLKLYVMGRAVQQVYPVLRFKQNGRLLLEKQTSAQREFVQFPISNGPITVTLINPFAGPIMDRNLDLQKLEFTPDS